MFIREDVDALRALIELAVAKADQVLTPEEWSRVCDLDVGAGGVLRELMIPLPYSRYRDRLPGTGLDCFGGGEPPTYYVFADATWLGAMRGVLRLAERRYPPRPRAGRQGPPPPLRPGPYPLELAATGDGRRRLPRPLERRIPR
jgi:hypothetical protein